MKITKDDAVFCIHCKIEINEKDLVDNGKCPKCGNEDYEEVLTEEWASLTEDEKEDYLQFMEDNSCYNSVRLSH